MEDKFPLRRGQIPALGSPPQGPDPQALGKDWRPDSFVLRLLAGGLGPWIQGFMSHPVLHPPGWACSRPQTLCGCAHLSPTQGRLPSTIRSRGLPVHTHLRAAGFDASIPKGIFLR